MKKTTKKDKIKASLEDCLATICSLGNSIKEMQQTLDDIKAEMRYGHQRLLLEWQNERINKKLKEIMEKK